MAANGNGLMSKGITKTIEVDDGSLVDYISTVRNLTKGNATVTVEDINDGTEGSKDTKILVDGTISTENDKTVQTTYGKKEATVTLELTAPVDKSLVEELLIAFKANNTNATAFKIYLSDDGQNYQLMADKSGVAYKSATEVKLDMDKYTKDTVKFVKIELTDGNVTWGYQISEIALMGTSVFMPTEAEGLVVTSDEFNKITVSFTGVSDTLGFNRI